MVGIKAALTVMSVTDPKRTSGSHAIVVAAKQARLAVASPV